MAFQSRANQKEWAIPMDRIQKTIFAAFAFAAASGAALSEPAVELTSSERIEVSKACKSGMPLIPVQSDFGYETGEFALPISQDGGEVNSALILTSDVLKEISGCSVIVEDAEKLKERAGSAAIS